MADKLVPKPAKKPAKAKARKKRKKTVTTVEEQSRPWEFKAGESGNPAGRPKGSRHKLSESFLAALREDFDEHGVKAIQDMRAADPGGYVKVCASLMPKDINVKVNEFDDLSDGELDDYIQRIAAALELTIGPNEGALGKEGKAGPKPTGKVSTLH